MNGFITFEGIEGSGKTTQIEHASRLLAERGIAHVRTREPGGSTIGDAVRRILLHPENRGMVPMTELLLIAAARVQHIEEVVLPALEEGEVVLCDRFEDSTRAYQGYGRQIPDNVLTVLSSLTVAELRPDLTFLFDLPVEEGLRRARDRNAGAAGDERRIDDEETEFHNRVRDGYLELARENPGRFRVIGAAQDPDKVARRVARALTLYLKLT